MPKHCGAAPVQVVCRNQNARQTHTKRHSPAAAQGVAAAGSRAPSEQQTAPDMSSPWLGCSTTVLTAARLSYSRWQPGARKSHIFTAGAVGQGAWSCLVHSSE